MSEERKQVSPAREKRRGLASKQWNLKAGGSEFSSRREERERNPELQLVPTRVFRGCL